MQLGRISLALAIWLATGGEAFAQDLCAPALAAVPGKSCVANAHGVALAPERSEAERIAAAVREGEARFARHFGRSPPRYAIVQDFRPEELRALNAAGFVRTLPWLTLAQLETASLNSIRRAAQAQAAALNLPAEQAAAVVQQAETQWRGRNSRETRIARDAGVLPHEIGHGWYVQLYWPGTAMDRTGHYGGPGPDWLDETAAILMETEAFAADRRRQFEQIYRGTAAASGLSAIPVDELIDLGRFLTRDHPGLAMQEVRRPPPGSGPQVRVLTGDEARRVAGGAALFYLQGRMFADFLIDRTGNPAIFAEIGAAFGRGQSIGQWLAERGTANRLPASVAELEAAWRAWLLSRFGPPADRLHPDRQFIRYSV